MTASPPASATSSPTISPTWTATPYLSPTPSFSFSPTPQPTATSDIPVVTSANVFKPEQGGTLTISLKAPDDGAVQVKVYNIAGELVRPVFDADVRSGLWFQANWDGKNSEGSLVASGVYFVSVKGAGIRMIRKVIVIK